MSYNNYHSHPQNSSTTTQLLNCRDDTDSLTSTSTPCISKMPKSTPTTYLHPVIVLNQVVFQFFNVIFAKMLNSLSTSYLLPAVLLNPCVVLHFFNTGVSHMIPGDYPPSTSPNQWLENLGPIAHSEPFFDVHKNEGLCWGYTAVVVVLQVLAFGKVSAARTAMKARKCMT